MNSSLHKILWYLSIFLSLVISGCSSLQIIDLHPQSLKTNTSNHERNTIVGIEELTNVAGGYEDAMRWQQGLADALRNEGAFQTILKTSTNRGNLDFLIRGKVSGKFRPNGTKNFFTWWPGPLVYAQGWRGTRYIFDTASDVEVIDAHSGEVLGNYHAESSHELIHKSYNPWHFFGTFLMFPGIIKGSLSVAPRPLYREQVYEVAYPTLWKKLAILIAEDQSKIYSQNMEVLHDKCGMHLDEELKIGMIWSEFVSCQTRKFRLLGQESAGSGLVSVYISTDKSLRIHVAGDDRVIRWYIAKPRR